MSDFPFGHSNSKVENKLIILKCYRTGAFKELTPHQPTGALISMPIISSVILQSLIQLIAQVKNN